MPLCTQADVEQKLQWDITAEPEAVITALIADAQATMEGEVGRDLESAERTEVYDGGTRAIYLQHWPVTEVDAVTEEGTLLVAATDYLFYPNGRLIRVSGDYQTWWAHKAQAIEVTYTGGYLAGTHDSRLKELGSICAEVVARAFHAGAKNAAVPVTAGAGGIQSVTLEGQGTVTYATASGDTYSMAGGLGQFIFLVEDERRRLYRFRSIGGFA